MQELNKSDISRLTSLLSEASDIVIVSHMKPDGDAIGSSMGFYSYLRKSGKSCRIVLPNPLPPYLGFLTEDCEDRDAIIYEDHPDEATNALRQADLIICLDFNAFHRTDNMEKILAGTDGAKVLIDHHLNPDLQSFDVAFSETEVSSASELLFHILMQMPDIQGDASRLPESCRKALMTGMTTDTNNFANSVYPSTLEMASSLLAAGTDRDEILHNLYNRFSENRLRLMGHMMKDLMKITDDGVAYIILDKETQKAYCAGDGDTEGFVNMPLSIDKVRMSFLLKEDGKRVRVSIRSKKGTSANRCAMLHFNGGGHENAAGGRLMIPDDIDSISSAARYIEEHTHKFLND